MPEDNNKSEGKKLTTQLTDEAINRSHDVLMDTANEIAAAYKRTNAFIEANKGARAEEPKGIESIEVLPA